MLSEYKIKRNGDFYIITDVKCKNKFIAEITGEDKDGLLLKLVMKNGSLKVARKTWINFKKSMRWNLIQACEHFYVNRW